MIALGEPSPTTDASKQSKLAPGEIASSTKFHTEYMRCVRAGMAFGKAVKKKHQQYQKAVEGREEKALMKKPHPASLQLAQEFNDDRPNLFGKYMEHREQFCQLELREIRRVVKRMQEAIEFSWQSRDQLKFRYVDIKVVD